jgi:hypothetical protein
LDKCDALDSVKDGVMVDDPDKFVHIDVSTPSRQNQPIIGRTSDCDRDQAGWVEG